MCRGAACRPDDGTSDRYSLRRNGKEVGARQRGAPIPPDADERPASSSECETHSMARPFARKIRSTVPTIDARPFAADVTSRLSGAKTIGDASSRREPASRAVHDLAAPGGSCTTAEGGARANIQYLDSSMFNFVRNAPQE